MHLDLYVPLVQVKPLPIPSPAQSRKLTYNSRRAWRPLRATHLGIQIQSHAVHCRSSPHRVIQGTAPPILEPYSTVLQCNIMHSLCVFVIWYTGMLDVLSRTVRSGLDPWAQPVLDRARIEFRSFVCDALGSVSSTSPSTLRCLLYSLQSTIYTLICWFNHLRI